MPDTIGRHTASSRCNKGGEQKQKEQSAAAEARLGLGVGLGRLGRGAPVYFLA